MFLAAFIELSSQAQIEMLTEYEAPISCYITFKKRVNGSAAESGVSRMQELQRRSSRHDPRNVSYQKHGITVSPFSAETSLQSKK